MTEQTLTSRPRDPVRPPRPGRRRAEKPSSQKKGFLPEVQGLRSLAVLMVVIYHVWLGRVSGGVDVFLLISAFLMTGQFVRRFERDQSVDLGRHWLHLFKRLLPLIVVVILAILGTTRLLVPQTRWEDILSQAWASLLYYENWALAANSVNYYAADDSLSSPFQHFWSLSIQGQVFILWPLIFVGTGMLVRRYRLKYKPMLAYVFSLIFTASLIFSVNETNSNQAFAYFDTRARLWEFALGSLLALALPYLKPPRPVRVFLGWFGVVAMISCGIILQVQQQFPGYIALWPTLAAACIIVAGQTGSRRGADRFLSSRPLVYMGNNSYALYLWHWPILIIYLIWAGQDRAGLLSGTAIILGSIVLAIVTTRIVETPVRRWKWAETSRQRAGIVIAVCVALVAAPLTTWQFQIASNAEKAAAQSAVNNPGGATLAPGYQPAGDPSAPLQPALTDLANEWPEFAGGCRMIRDSDAYQSRCDNGKTDNPAKTIVVLGSSHANVWATPFLAMADKYNWHVVSMTGGFCPLSAGDDKTLADGCVDFDKKSIAEAIQLKPDMVVTTSTRAGYDNTKSEYLDPSWTSEVKQLTDAGIHVTAIRDNPRFDQTNVQSGPDCVAKNLNNYAACSIKKDEALAETSPTDKLVGTLPGVTFLDFTQYFCPDSVCPAVIGNVVVYKDGNHVTSTYMKTITPFVEKEFLQAVGWA